MTPTFAPEDLTASGNAVLPRHRWFTLTEGFGAGFVEKCLGHAGARPGAVIMDPFAGCGTGAVVAATRGYRGHFIEVNPLLSFTVKTKLASIAKPEEFYEWAARMVDRVRPVRGRDLAGKVPAYPTLRRGNRFGRWLYHDTVLSIVLPLLKRSSEERSPRGALLKLALARSAERLSNAKRDGKAVRYRKEWRRSVPTVDRVRQEIKRDLLLIASDLVASPLTEDGVRVWGRKSAFDVLPKVKARSVDVVVTSPPYLNSRDYTDVFNGDMWLLGFVESYTDVRRLRRKCVDSHVQLYSRPHRASEWPRVERLVDEIAGKRRPHWQARVPQMVGGYFGDMSELLGQLHRVLKPGGSAYVNVAESAYCGVKIETLDLLAGLGRRVGFESRKLVVRSIRRSSQQFHKVKSLDEGVLVFTK